MKLVLASSLNHYEVWCLNHGVDPHRGAEQAIFVSSRDHLRGRIGAGNEVVILDDWERGKHWTEIFDMKIEVNLLIAKGATVIDERQPWPIAPVADAVNEKASGR